MKLSEKLRDAAYWQSGRHKDLAYQAADELERLAAEVEALTAARDDFRLSSEGYRRELDRLASALPKTADGVTIVPGMEVLFTVYEGNVYGPYSVCSVAHDLEVEMSTAYDRVPDWHSPSEIYSTRQAAEEAADNEN